MNLENLLNITEGILLNNYKKIKIKDFKTDTRTLKKGDCFIALKGKKYDANKFINDKLKCSVIITDKSIKLKNIPVIKVDDTYEVLYKLGIYFRNNYKNKVICITGSNGKTTLKELLYNILSSKYKVLKNIGNENNIIGVFNTIKKLNNEYDFALFELGMNHKGEIERLSKMTKPTTAIITNVGSSHIGNLGSRKNIYKAKMEIKNGLIGNIILNGDNKYLKKAKGYKCGINCNNDLIAYKIYSNSKYLLFNIYLDDEYEIIFKNPAKDYIPILLETIKIGIDNNIDIQTIIKVIKEYKTYKKRLDKIVLKDFTIIDDSYNASYESVKCGLTTLKEVKQDKLIILGDMLELGKFSKKYHKKINNILRTINKKKVLTVGNDSKFIHSLHFKNNKDLINYLKTINLDGKCIYVKGSNAMKLYEIIDYLKKI